MFKVEEKQNINSEPLGEEKKRKESSWKKTYFPCFKRYYLAIYKGDKTRDWVSNPPEIISGSRGDLLWRFIRDYVSIHNPYFSAMH